MAGMKFWTLVSFIRGSSRWIIPTTVVDHMQVRGGQMANQMNRWIQDRIREHE